MNDETLTALKGSIAKWEAIVAGTGEDNGWKNCPLCVMFNNPNDVDRDYVCGVCPVVAAVGATECEETPYYEWVDTFGMLEIKAANTPERQKLAQQELDFLRSLLPAVAPAHTSPDRTPEPSLNPHERAGE